MRLRRILNQQPLFSEANNNFIISQTLTGTSSDLIVPRLFKVLGQRSTIAGKNPAASCRGVFEYNIFNRYPKKGQYTYVVPGTLSCITIRFNTTQPAWIGLGEKDDRAGL